MGGTTVTVYNPHPVAYQEPNDRSLVLMLEYAGRKVLIRMDNRKCSVV
ncbi:MAG: hypothetical protein RR893_11695 [Clostridia bacterium]